jgi:hypothetical protein
MTTLQIIGWKTYAVGAVAIVAGLIAWTQGYVGDGLKGIIGGFALISLRDAVAKILRAIEDNRAALDNMRAAIDTHWKSNSRG